MGGDPVQRRIGIIREALAASWQSSTRKRYEKWWKEFAAFSQGAGLEPTASPEQAIEATLHFAATLIDERRFNPAVQAVCAIAGVLKFECGFAINKDPRFTALLKTLRKYAHIFKEPVPSRDPLPPSAVAHFVSYPPRDLSHFEWALRAAIAAVGIRCIRRGKDLRDLEEHHLSDLGNGTAKIRIVFAKNDPAGIHHLEVPFKAGTSPADPIACLDRYLRIAKGRPLHGWVGQRGVPLFVNQDGSRISGKQVADLVSHMARHAGLQGRFLAHSLRIGGAASAIGGGMSQEQIMAIGGWRAGSSLGAYARAIVGVQQQASARMGL